MCISPLLSGLSLCLSVPFSPLSFHLHFSFVERNSRLLAYTIARTLAYESSRGAVSEAGKREGRRVIKLSNQSQADIRTLISLMVAHVSMWHMFPLGKSLIFECKKNRGSLLFLFHPCDFIHGHCSVPPDSLNMSMITDKLIFSAPGNNLSSAQDVQTLMVILPAPYTLLSGIKSINRKDLFRSVEILMWSQMRPCPRKVDKSENVSVFLVIVIFGKKRGWPGYSAEYFKPLFCPAILHDQCCIPLELSTQFRSTDSDIMFLFWFET